VSSGVVVGYDGSEGGKAALRAALELGRAYGERVTIAFAYAVSPVGGELHDYHAALRELATSRVAEALGLAASDDTQDVEGVVIEEDPARGLVELAGERDARAIVVGTRGESPVIGALLGSTAHKLLHLSDRPVLVVPVAQAPHAG
jgi:nucleotide-binding universal stress UspA family protein